MRSILLKACLTDVWPYCGTVWDRAVNAGDQAWVRCFQVRYLLHLCYQMSGMRLPVQRGSWY
eukprot:2239486-Rhodomonas_salina.1